MSETKNAWEPEEDPQVEKQMVKVEKTEAKRRVFSQIGFLRDEGYERPEVEKRLLDWGQEDHIPFTASQLLRMVGWTYRNWD